MRKLFYCCLAGAGVLVAGAFAMTNHAIHHPQSLAARVLVHASYLTATVNPLQGFAPTAPASLPETSPVCQESACEKHCPIRQQQSEPASAAPIVICEDETPPTAPEEVLTQIQHANPFQPETECPAGARAAAPALMPYAEEESEAAKPVCRQSGCAESCQKGKCRTCGRCAKAENVEQLHMPTISEPEQLTMPPTAEEEQEEDCPECCPLGGVKKMLQKVGQVFEQAAQEPVAEQPSTTPDCREDVHHHHHYQGCPYSGRSYCPCPRAYYHHPVMTPMPNQSQEPMNQASPETKEQDGQAPVKPPVGTLEIQPDDQQPNEIDPLGL